MANHTIVVPNKMASKNWPKFISIRLKSEEEISLIRFFMAVLGLVRPLLPN